MTASRRASSLVQPFGRCAPTGFVLEVEVTERLAGGVLHDEAGVVRPSSVQGGGKRRGDGMQHDNAISALHRKRPSAVLKQAVAKGHVWTVPAVQEESDFSAKRSGAAMYTACFRLEDYLGRDAATVAAGPDVIR